MAQKRKTLILWAGIKPDGTVMPETLSDKRYFARGSTLIALRCIRADWPKRRREGYRIGRVALRPASPKEQANG